MFFLLQIVCEVEIELPWDRTEDVERHGPVARALQIESDGLVVKLTAWDSSETVNIQAIANFLSGAVEHFKGIRSSENGLYEGGPYCEKVRNRPKLFSSMQLASTCEGGLTAVQWTDAVINAYVNAHQIEQIIASLSDWQEAGKHRESWLRDIVEMVSKPGGELRALEQMMQRELGREGANPQMSS